jgi:aminoglycoside phosphotransferase (APT) family kinase protein
LPNEAQNTAWFFLEEAVGEDYSLDLPSHAQLVATWLGALHTTTIDSGLKHPLPAKPASHYFSRLCALHERLNERRGECPDSTKDAVRLKKTGEACRALKAAWPQIEEWASVLPMTLVHGDLAPENVKVRATPEGGEVLAFDWEKAGYGNPAVDAVRVDAETYWQAVRSSWPTVDRQKMEQALGCGAIFHTLSKDAIFRTLSKDWRSTKKLKNFCKKIDVGLSALGLVSKAR